MINWLLIQGVTAPQYLDAWDHGKMEIPDGSGSKSSDEVPRWLAGNRNSLDVRFNEKSEMVGVFFEDVLMAQHSDMQGLPPEGREAIMNIYDRMRGALEAGGVYNPKNWGQPSHEDEGTGRLEKYIDEQYSHVDDRWDITRDGESIYLPTSEELDVLEFASIKSAPEKVADVVAESVSLAAPAGRGYKGPDFGSNRAGPTAPR